METYRIAITEKGTETGIAQADGDLDTIAYVSRKATETVDAAKDGAEFTVVLSRTDGINRPATTHLLDVSVDAEWVGPMLKKKIAAERKASAPAAVTE